MYDIRNLSISSTHPCLIIYLIDQSGSMEEIFGNAAHTKAQETANAINETIFEIGNRCLENGKIKNRFELAVLGYGGDSNSVRSGWEGALAGKWVVPIKDVFDYPLDVENDLPIWVKAYAKGGTPMARAFENAKRLCADWINWGNHIDCHPPIIINITDGAATDGGHNYCNVIHEVEEIKSLGTNYGAVNILNIHISAFAGERLLFPPDINHSDKLAKLLFNISSPLTGEMVRIAAVKGYNITDGARGYIFNGNPSDLLNFLNIGTPQ